MFVRRVIGIEHRDFMISGQTAGELDKDAIAASRFDRRNDKKYIHRKGVVVVHKSRLAR